MYKLATVLAYLLVCANASTSQPRDVADAGTSLSLPVGYPVDIYHSIGKQHHTLRNKYV
jgi:hypothetical protein